MNSYPFLNNKTKPVFTSDLADITPRVRRERVIDISSSPLVSAKSLRDKIRILHEAGELDGGLPILRQDVLVGLIPAPDLEFALDSLPDEENDLCLMVAVKSFDDDDDETADPTDFTSYIDPVGTPNISGPCSNADFKRLLWHSTFVPRWIWYMSVLSSLDFDIFAFYVMVVTQEW